MARTDEHEVRGDVRPWPLADWRQILGASDPVADATQQRLRTLRGNSVLSEGIQEAMRESGRLGGKLSLFCELNIDAAVLARKGLDDLSVSYREAASALEKMLSAMLSSHHVRAAELLKASVPRSPAALKLLWDFSEACTRARAGLPPVPDEDVVTGMLAEHSGSWVRFSCVDRGRDFDIPWAMVRRAGLSVGDPAVVARELLANGNAVLRLHPGLRLPAPDDLEEADDHRLESVARRPIRSAERREKLIAELGTEEPLIKRVRG